MTSKVPGKAFFERAVTIHRYDCKAIPIQNAGNANTDDWDASLAHRNDTVAAYVVRARPVYDGIRRLIGHVAGILVLVQAGGRRDVLDLPDIPVARTRWQEIEAGLQTLRVPSHLDAHFRRLEAAHEALGKVLDDFDTARHRRDWECHIDRAGEKIKLAYARFQAASNQQAGMTPVDFNSACCCCAAPVPQGR